MASVCTRHRNTGNRSDRATNLGKPGPNGEVKSCHPELQGEREDLHFGFGSAVVRAGMRQALCPKPPSMCVVHCYSSRTKQTHLSGTLQGLFR